VASPQEQGFGYSLQALKGRNTYVALSGLDEITQRYSCGVAPGFYIAPLWGFFKQLLKSNSLLPASQ
jgi:hypothetical protein